MRRRDNVTGVTVRVVFLEAISQMGSLSLFIYLFVLHILVIVLG